MLLRVSFAGAVSVKLALGLKGKPRQVQLDPAVLVDFFQDNVLDYPTQIRRPNTLNGIKVYFGL